MLKFGGLTIDFYLSRTRNAKAAKRFLGKAVKGRKEWEMPRVINTDKAGCYGIAINELKKEGKLFSPSSLFATEPAQVHFIKAPYAHDYRPRTKDHPIRLARHPRRYERCDVQGDG